MLTRASSDQAGNSQLEYWLATDNGPVRLVVEGEQPILFIDQSARVQAAALLKREGVAAELKPLSLSTFQHQSVLGVYSANINHHRRAQRVLGQMGIELLEADIRLHNRYLMERFIYGGVEFIGVPVAREGFTELRQCRLRPSDCKPLLRVLSLDIECDLDGELFSVGLYCADLSIAEVLMIGSPQPCEETRIEWCSSERELLRRLINKIEQLDPDVLIGWSLVDFDLRILMKRAEKLRVPFTIGRDKSQPHWRDAPGDNTRGFMDIPGRVAIDGISGLKNATYQFDSFSLESVSRQLLGRGKQVEDVDDRMAEIRHNFHHDKPALAAYNLEDCRLVWDIFEHTQLLDFLLLRSQLTGLELDRSGGSVAAFTNLYLPKLHRAGYVAPNLPADGGLVSPGGYVMDSRPGLYRNVLVLDYKSLYPSIIRTFKVDPLGLVEGLKHPDQAIEGFRGGCFDRSKHFLPDIITGLWRQRDQAKKDNDQPRSQAIKILMNSFYGVLGSGGCRFYDTRLASSITLRGHQIMQTTAGWIEEQGYQVIYGDTDSTFVWLDGEVSASRAKEIGAELAAMINVRWQQELKDRHQLESHLEIEFETHFSRFLMPTIRGSEAGSKKRYAGLIENADGEKMVFKGLETVRTDWTELAKRFQVRLFELLFHDGDPSALVRQTVDDTLAGRCNELLVYRKRLRRKLVDYQRNVPPHVRAARLADQRNAELGRSLKYQSKGVISYLMTTNGPEPLEYVSSPIDYQHYIDRQLKPVADAILPFAGLDFDQLISAQLGLL